MQTGFSLLFTIPACAIWRVILHILCFLFQIIIVNMISKLSFSNCSSNVENILLPPNRSDLLLYSVWDWAVNITFIPWFGLPLQWSWGTAVDQFSRLPQNISAAAEFDSLHFCRLWTWRSFQCRKKCCKARRSRDPFELIVELIQRKMQP